MGDFAIISKKTKEVYVGDSVNVSGVLRVYRSRLLRGKYVRGKFWWLQESYDRVKGDGFEYVDIDSSGRKLGVWKGLWVGDGYKVYDNDSMPKRARVRNNFYVPEEYVGSVSKLVGMLGSGLLSVKEFEVYCDGVTGE